MPSLKDRLIQKLVEKELATEEKLARAFAYQTEHRTSFRDALIKLKILSERELLHFLSDELSLPVIDLSKLKVAPDVAQLIGEDLARMHCVLPITRIGDTLTVAMADPLNVIALDDIKSVTKLDIIPVLALRQDIVQSIEEGFGKDVSTAIEEIVDDVSSQEIEFLGVVEQPAEDEEYVQEMVHETPVVRATEMLLEQAIRRQASDILIEPLKQRMRIRYRIDGLWHEFDSFPRAMHEAVISRIKVMSELDIAERRVPQDGRFKVKFEGRHIDFRISLLPSVLGEKVAIRLLDKQVVMLDVDQLGFDPVSLRNLKKVSLLPHGMMLVCGPTGSGKTTTLYSILKYLDSPEKNLVTVEDPVEYQIDGVNQTSVNTDIGFTFARALRSILRQDPEIIMVGEIRDYETVDIAIKSALTGHFVLSTLHTTTAIGSIVRLANMGVEPFLIAGSVVCVCSQRLLRKLCPRCKKAYTPNKTFLKELNIDLPSAKSPTFYEPHGCAQCFSSGYSGRIGVMEVVGITMKIREQILKQSSERVIQKIAREEGFTGMRQNALARVVDGTTSLEEVIRTTVADGH